MAIIFLFLVLLICDDNSCLSVYSKTRVSYSHFSTFINLIRKNYLFLLIYILFVKLNFIYMKFNLIYIKFNQSDYK